MNERGAGARGRKSPLPSEVMAMCERESVSVCEEKRGGEWRLLSAVEERQMSEILGRIERAERVVVTTERCGHGEQYIDAYGNLQLTSVFEDFFVIKIDNDKFIFKIESDGDFEIAENISQNIHEKVVDVISERIEEEFEECEWDGGCDYGCCLFFKSKEKCFRVRFAEFNDMNTTHYKASSTIYTLKDFSVSEEL